MRHAKRASAIALLAMLAGCSSPNPHYFVLTPVPGPTIQVATALNAPAVVAIRKIVLASYLDRPEIVQNAEGPHLHVSSRDVWGEPLQDMLTRLVTEDLNQRLAPAVLAEGEPASVPASATVQISVQHFSAEAGQVTLRAQVAITRPHPTDRQQLRLIALCIPQQGHGSASLAASMSSLLGQLADQVAVMLATQD